VTFTKNGLNRAKRFLDLSSFRSTSSPLRCLILSCQRMGTDESGMHAVSARVALQVSLEEKELRGLLSSFLVQLCPQSNSYFDILSNFYSEHGKGLRPPSDDALAGCLKDLLKLPGLAPVYLTSLPGASSPLDATRTTCKPVSSLFRILITIDK
jgi:hypothetical protein